MKREYLRLGLLVGAAIVLVGHFATRSAAKSDNQLFLFWAALGLGLGLLVAFALDRYARSQQPDDVEEGSIRLSTGEVKAIIPTTSRFYALSRKPSSSELKALMVDAPTIPGNPISTRLQLIVERFDAYSRVKLIEGTLLDYPVREVAERARDEALSRMPATSSEVNFELASVLAEGPVNPEGRSPFGWTFAFLDGAIGVGCTVTVTDNEMLLVYRTAVSYAKGAVLEWVSPKRARAAVLEAVPALASAALYLRVELPDEYYLFTRRPLHLVEVAMREGTVVAPDLLAGMDAEPMAEDAPTVSSVVATLASDDDDTRRTELLGQRGEVHRSTAARLLRHHGPQVVGELAGAIRSSLDEPPVAQALLSILGLVPSNLALLALVELSEELPTEMQGVAFSLFERRRHEELDVEPDPVSALDFEESRALLGKVDCQRIALRSTYDPEGELLPELDRLGLKATRIRLLSGDTELFLSANLASGDKRTEGLLSSSPLPVPCHILRIVGADAEGMAQRVRESALCYSRERIVEDILDGRPYDVHRGALYLAALSIDAPETFETLQKAALHHRTNIELRRAALAALAQLTHEHVDEILESVEDADLVDLSRTLLARRRAASEPTGQSGPEIQVSAVVERPVASEEREVSDSAAE